MENNESSNKPQQTGGLKLMTVFVVVLALHVVVIGGMTAYYLMRGSQDADVMADQTHKTVKVTPDGALPGDATSPDSNDKTASNTPTTPTDTSAPTTPAPTPVTDTPAPVADTPAPTDTHVATTTHAGPVVMPTVPQVPTSDVPSGPVQTPPVDAAPVAVNGTPYVVKPRDSLARIAHQNHTSVAKLKAANGLTNDMLRIGQKLVIPARTQVAAAPAPVVPSAPTPTTTILSDSVTTPSITSAPAPAPTASAVSERHLYTVVKGDTLTKIARKFKTTPTAIMTANNLTDPTKLSIGKKLKIPSQESRSATNDAPVPAPAQPQPAPVQGKSSQLANFIP